jgi:hypothetical protein
MALLDRLSRQARHGIELAGGGGVALRDFVASG